MTDAPREPSGVYIGPWRLVCELGKGGMAQVFQAVKEFPGGGTKTAGVKIPRLAAVADRRAREQFEGECTIALMMEHDHLIRAFDRGVHNGVPYLVLDFVAGKNIAQINARMAKAELLWSFDAVAHVGRAIGSALRYIHGFGPGGKPMSLVHRDVAAKNVIVSGDGGVFLSDFGIASANVVHTDGSMFKGTWQYVPPEQVGGEIGPWCDAFGLGTLLWEMIELRLFRGDLDDKAVRQAAVEGRVPALRREGVPAVLARVVQGLLDADWRARMTIGEAMDLLPRASMRDELGGNTQRLFGAVVSRTGHTMLDFEIPEELRRTIAIAEAATGGAADLPTESEPNGRDEVPRDEVRAAGASTADFGPRRLPRRPTPDDAAMPIRTVPERREAAGLARVSTTRLHRDEARPAPPGPTAFVAEPRSLAAAAVPEVTPQRRATHPDVPDSSPNDDIAVQVPITVSRGASMSGSVRWSRVRVPAIGLGVLLLVVGTTLTLARVLSPLPEEGQDPPHELVAEALPSIDPAVSVPPIQDQEVDLSADGRASLPSEPVRAAPSPAPATDAAPLLAPPPAILAVETPSPAIEPAPALAPVTPVVARPKTPAAAKATARLRLLTKQAELRIGHRTIAMSSTGTHSLDLSVASGRQKLRWRLTAADPWQTVAVSFEPREQVTIFVERTGPRVARPEKKP